MKKTVSEQQIEQVVNFLSETFDYMQTPFGAIWSIVIFIAFRMAWIGLYRVLTATDTRLPPSIFDDLLTACFIPHHPDNLDEDGNPIGSTFD